jgi:GTP pyrophosphokinase
VAECYEALGVVHEICHPLKGRIKDYIASPKPNGYQSIHTTVFSPTGEIVEVQIRTKDMHEEDEFGIAAHWLYKEKHNMSDLDRQKYNWLQQLLDIQKNATTEQDYSDSLKIDIFPNQIFVFTPNGDVIELPEDSTPVDFAYRIHTDLGDKCVGSKVNDQIASLSTKLRSGDMVEVFTDKNRKGPNPDWLEFVKTSSARERIKTYVNKRQLPSTPQLFG